MNNQPAVYWMILPVIYVIAAILDLNSNTKYGNTSLRL